MAEDRYKQLLSVMPEIAKAINAFNSEQVQQLAFQAMLKALTGQAVKVADEKGTDEDDGTTREKRQDQAERETREQESGPDILKIATAIRDADNYSEIDENILKKNAQLPRILLCLHHASGVPGPDTLTTGQIQDVTSELGVQIKAQNVNNTITKQANRKYFAPQKVRKPGAKVPYKLNRRGIEAYKKVVKGEKL